jgi:hypothetical protein
MKSIKKLKLTRESIRLLSKEALRGVPIAGGNSGQESCAGSCEPSGIVACTPSRILEQCV